MSLAEFNQNLLIVTEKLTNDDSFVIKQKEQFRELLKEFSIDNEQLGAILADANKSILEEINKLAVATALDLIKIKNQTAESNAKVAMLNSQRLLYDAQKGLADQEKLTEREQTDLTGAQIQIAAAQRLLVVRQTLSYDDKKRMAKAEEASGMAKMALNAGANNVNDTITYAKTQIDAI